MIYDTHCHPYLQKTKNKTIETFKKENPEGFLNIIGTDLETSEKSIEMSRKYNFTYATIGIHPCDIENPENLNFPEIFKKLEKLYLKNTDKVVGIGECGLDYYRIKAENNPKTQKYKKEDQKELISLQKKLQFLFFKTQIELAKIYNLPVIIHNREAKNDIYNILKETGVKKFIFHCYSEDLDYAKKLLNLSDSAMISFSGILTFKNALELQKTVREIPLKNILVETDSPYLTPVPYRGKEENEPLFIKYIIEKIVELRGENKEKVLKQIFENSKKIFGINL